MRTVTVTLGLFLSILLANGQEVSLKGIYLGAVYDDSTSIWTTVADHWGNLKVARLKDKRVARVSFHVTQDNFNDDIDTFSPIGLL